MARGDFDTILADCLERLAQGESRDTCLARYPGHAAELEPALAAAEALAQLGTLRLPGRAREQGRLRMRRALVEANRRPRAPLGVGWLRGLAGALALLVLVAALANLIYTSQPGDWAYRYRINVERVPARMAARPADRATVELRVAGARLADVAQVVSRGKDASLPLQALLISDAAAVEAAHSLSTGEQAAITAIVRSHAETLEGMAASAGDGATQAALTRAAQQLHRLIAGPASDQQSPDQRSPTTSATPGPIDDGEAIAPALQEDRATPSPTATATRIMPRATATATPVGVQPSRATPAAGATPTGPATRPAIGPTGTPDFARRAETPEPSRTKTPDSSGPGSGRRTPEPTDDHGGPGSGSTPEPTDDHSGSGDGTPRPTDDHTGSDDAAPQPTDDHVGSGGGHSGSGGGN